MAFHPNGGRFPARVWRRMSFWQSSSRLRPASRRMISRSRINTNKPLVMRGSGSKSIFLAFFALCILALSAAAQDAEQRSANGRVEGPDQPKGMQEMMKKMQIDQAKKEYEEMLDRGQQALRI